MLNLPTDTHPANTCEACDAIAKAQDVVPLRVLRWRKCKPIPGTLLACSMQDREEVGMTWQAVLFTVATILLMAANASAQQLVRGGDPVEGEYPTGPEIGEPIPDFTLPDAFGKPVHFAAERGSHKALILFYRSASW